MANANADYFSRQRREEALKDIRAEFLNEFQEEPDRKEEQVFHIHGKDESEFSNIISYLIDKTYPTGLSTEEKSIF